ncbi:hypothetical protein BKA80DRAFT_250632 [Phyllosticta citrichinensis]
MLARPLSHFLRSLVVGFVCEGLVMGVGDSWEMAGFVAPAGAVKCASGVVVNGVTFAAPYEPGSATDWFEEYCRRRGFSLFRPPPPLPPLSDVDLDDYQIIPT